MSLVASRMAAADSFEPLVAATRLRAVRNALRWDLLRAVWVLACRICFLADLVLGTAIPHVLAGHVEGPLATPGGMAKYSRGNTLTQETWLTQPSRAG